MGMKVDSALYETTYHSIDDVIQGLNALREAFVLMKDRRGVFITAYAIITGEIKRRIDAQWFIDNPWVERYAVSFANLYRTALMSYEQHDSPPKAWDLSLRTSERGDGLVLQDLLLGINSHINHDLPIALEQVSIDPDRPARHQDHDRVNDVIKAITGTIKTRIIAVYAPGLGPVDSLLGPLDDQITQFSFEAARENAWFEGVTLVNARDKQEQASLEQMLDNRSAILGHLILAPTEHNPLLLSMFRAVEQARPWWETLSVTPSTDHRALVLALPRFELDLVTDHAYTGVVLRDEIRNVAWIASATSMEVRSDAGGRAAAIPRSAEQNPVTTLDQVIERLGEIVAKFDARRSRLSIYPTVYRIVTQHVKTAIEQGLFLDPDWMTQLDVHFANRYFQILTDYEARQSVPRCWAVAFQAIESRRTTIIQDIALQINGRVNYDLPIALEDTGMEGNLENRLRDYEATYQLFMDEFDQIKRMLAKKYTSFLLVEMLDPILGELDKFIANREYVKARKVAWENGLALQHEPTTAGREALIRLIDTDATAYANNLLGDNIYPVTWVTGVFRFIEERFSGSWSEWAENAG
jgi:hypothetical protein